MALSPPQGATRTGPLAALTDGGRPLAALLALALGFKLLVALAAAPADPLTLHPAADARYYLDRAAGIAGRRDDPLADDPYHLPPLYPLVLAAIPGAVDGEHAGVRVLQALAGTALLAATFVFARRRLSRPAALAAAALTAFYGPLTFYETQLLGDQLATTLLVVALVVADVVHDRGRERPVSRFAALLGLLLALACLARPQALALLPVVFAWLLAARRRGATAFALACLAVLAPSWLHNLRSGGGAAPVSANGGVNFWIASTGPVSGTFEIDRSDLGDIATQAAVSRSIAEQVAGERLSAAGASRWFLREALTHIVDAPAEFAARLVARGRALLESFETDIASFPPVQGALMGPLRLLALPFGLLAGLAASAWLLRPGPRGGAPTECAAALGRAPAARLPALALAAMVVLTTLAFFHYSRFRLPLVSLLAVVAAGALDAWRQVRPAPARLAVAGLAGLAITAQSFLPAPHHARTIANGWASVGWARLATLPPGDAAGVERVLQDARRALDAQPHLIRAELLAARCQLMLGRFDDCAAHLDEIERRAPGYALARLDRAWLLATRHPGNRHHDAQAAASLARALLVEAADDALVSTRAAELIKALER